MRARGKGCDPGLSTGVLMFRYALCNRRNPSLQHDIYNHRCDIDLF
jgi:hypothetical protein